MIKIDTTHELGAIVAPLVDAASSGLAFLLRTVNGESLTPIMFCKDFLQDFIFVNTFNTEKPFEVYGYSPKHIPNLLEDNAEFELLLFPHAKGAKQQSELISYPKAKLAVEAILNEEVIKSFKEQLQIFENQLIKIGFLNFKTKVNLVTVTGQYPSKNPMEQNAISLVFDKTYFHKPELFSLYVLLVRNFLTMKIFVKDFEDIYTFFRDFSKYNIKYIYESDLMIFNNPAVRLNLPMYLTGKLVNQTWENYKNSDSYQVHNSSGIYSYLTSKLLSNV